MNNLTISGAALAVALSGASPAQAQTTGACDQQCQTLKAEYEAWLKDNPDGESATNPARRAPAGAAANFTDIFEPTINKGLSARSLEIEKSIDDIKQATRGLLIAK